MKSEWTPCKEELPKKADTYIVAWLPKDRKFVRKNHECFLEFLEFDGYEWENDIPQSGKSGFDVLAWMPLPERYRWE